MTPLRILFVARPYSIHSARWINQIADEGWDLHLFPSSEAPAHQDYAGTESCLMRCRLVITLALSYYPG